MMLMMILKQLMLDPTALIRAAKQVLAEFGSCCSIDGSGAITFFYTFTAVLDFDIKNMPISFAFDAGVRPKSLLRRDSYFYHR